MPGALYIGIDISGWENLACFLNEDGDKIKPVFKFLNDKSGLNLFLSEITTCVNNHGPNQVDIGMEARGFYWWHLQEAFSDVHFDGTEVNIFTINPKLIKNFKKAYPTLPKTDAIDVFIIADLLRFGRLSPLHEGRLIYAPLARLTRM